MKYEIALSQEERKKCIVAMTITLMLISVTISLFNDISTFVGYFGLVSLFNGISTFVGYLMTMLFS